MDPLAPLIDALHSEGRPRVWSLVITVFGDMVQHRGGVISTARLGQLLGRVGIEQGALRTALSRLTSDGWVLRERHGRTSHYRLSPEGRDRFAPATTRIYAPPRASPVARWAAVVQLGPTGGQTVTICPAEEAPDEADCRIVGTLDWVSEAYRLALLDPEHRAALQALAADLVALTAEIAVPLEAAAARMLLIHRWRRIVLRFPEILPELMPPDTPLRNPRAAVAQAYSALAAAAEAWLDSECAGFDPMPPAAPGFAQRFANRQKA